MLSIEINDMMFLEIKFILLDAGNYRVHAQYVECYIKYSPWKGNNSVVRKSLINKASNMVGGYRYLSILDYSKLIEMYVQSMIPVSNVLMRTNV